MIELLLFTTALAFLEFIWLRTDAFIVFLGWILKPANVFYVRDYANSTNRKFLEYPLWLHVNKPNFLTKVISCPLCLGFWLNALYWLVIVNHLKVSTVDICVFLSSCFLTLVWFCLLDKLYTHNLNE